MLDVGLSSDTCKCRDIYNNISFTPVAVTSQLSVEIQEEERVFGMVDKELFSKFVI